MKELSAFRHEYKTAVNYLSLKKDIESYLGEYRFSISKYDYSLRFIPEKGLCDVFEGEPMKDKAKRAIARRQRNWLPMKREMAELEGIEVLESRLESAEAGDAIIWASPPGLKEEGYGNYGFMFLGKVGEAGSISMTAYRVEQPTMDQFNTALSLLGDTNVSFKKPEDFLRNPLVKKMNLEKPEEFLKGVFFYERSSIEFFNRAMRILNPHINEFVAMIKRGGPKSDIIKAFHAIENFAIKLNTEAQNEKPFLDLLSAIPFARIVEKYSYRPPAVAGSCGKSGSTSGLESANIFNELSSLEETTSESSEVFTCPSCNKDSIPPIGEQCPKCGITKDEAAEKGLITCD